MKDTIKSFFKGDIDDSNEVLVSHSRDASLFEMRPELVVYPKDSVDVSKLVAFVSKEKDTNPHISITARSAGTCMSGGSLTSSISLDCMRYLNKIESMQNVRSYEYLPHFPQAHLVEIAGEAKVDVGVFYRDFERSSLEQNLLLPCFTASKSINAIGGMIGNNSGGELSLKYGKMEDYIKELEVVFADGSCESVMEVPIEEARRRALQGDFVGDIYKKILYLLEEKKSIIESKRPHVSKNSAGYNIWNVIRTDAKTGIEMFDLSQLLVGSQGTLGIVTGAQLRLIKTKKESAMLVCFLHDLKFLPDILAEIHKAEPDTIEAYDDKTILLAIKFWRGFIKQKGFLGACKMGLNFLPEFFMMLHGMPKLVLLVECNGDNHDEVLARVELLQKRVAYFSRLHTRVAKNKKAGEKYWMIRHDSFALLREHLKDKRTAPFIDDVIVPPEKLPVFLPAIREILERNNLSYNIHGHAGNGNFHIIPFIEPNAQKSKQMILDVSEEVYALVLRLGGSITAEHNDGIIRTPFLKDMFGEEMYEIFSEIKTICDPKNILNPGKKIGLKKADIGQYLIGE